MVGRQENLPDRPARGRLLPVLNELGCENRKSKQPQLSNCLLFQQCRNVADQPDGSGALLPLAGFVTNPAGSAIVNAVGPLRQIVQNEAPALRRYLVILGGTPDALGTLQQAQAD